MRSGETFKLSDYEETIRLVLESGGEFRMYPKGTSMLPLIVQGRDSVVLIRPENKPVRGDIIFYLRENGQYVLHRIVDVEDGMYVLCGDNQVSLEPGIREEQVIGVVKSVFRGEKCISKKTVGYGIYLFLWRSFLIRRIYLKLRRMIHDR